MRDYGKVAPQFWIGETGRQIRTLGPLAQVTALYLITSPHSNWLGLYYLPIPLLSHEIGISNEGASEALQSLSEVGFAHYDAPSEWVWVPEMARFQIGESLKADDNRVKGINKDYQSLPNNPFLQNFYDKYHEAYHLEKPRGFKGPSKGVRSQEQEQEHLQEQEQDKKPLSSDPPKLAIVPATPLGQPSPRKRRSEHYEDYPGFCELYELAVIRPSHGKGNKAEALTRWRKLKPCPEDVPILLEQILTAYAYQKTSQQWQKDNGQYVPEIQVWVGKKAWEGVVIPQDWDRHTYQPGGISDALRRRLDQIDREELEDSGQFAPRHQRA